MPYRVKITKYKKIVMTQRLQRVVLKYTCFNNHSTKREKDFHAESETNFPVMTHAYLVLAKGFNAANSSLFAKRLPATFCYCIAFFKSVKILIFHISISYMNLAIFRHDLDSDAGILPALY